MNKIMVTAKTSVNVGQEPHLEGGFRGEFLGFDYANKTVFFKVKTPSGRINKVRKESVVAIEEE